ncbi:hypothetical protein COV12_02825 [Candidatus Woesearchaeota archaeon CG10_big_fil_rev_8_21_14_0_10_32_24]|nr:MAG: hypothetical protein COV12_02825 [Candidatus Woesearchaeota archaeon CG10_big_fil_rev_8_21_14_0_10_32_24]
MTPTKLIKHLTLLVTLVSLACSPAYVQKSEADMPSTPVSATQPIGNYHSRDIAKNSLYVPSDFDDNIHPSDEKTYQFVDNSTPSYGKIHPLGPLDVSRKPFVPIDIGHYKPKIHPVSFSFREKPSIEERAKDYAQELTKNVCMDYLPMCGRSASPLNLEDCIDITKKICDFERVKDARTNSSYRSCIEHHVFNHTLFPRCI